MCFRVRDSSKDVIYPSALLSAHYGNAAIAAQLLEKGADVNFPAKHHISPLHVAAKWGKTNMVKLLLDKGANLDASTRVSVCSRRFVMIRKLLAAAIAQRFYRRPVVLGVCAAAELGLIDSDHNKLSLREPEFRLCADNTEI